MRRGELKHIELHRLAPTKPKTGQPCNGCGVCCAVEPCPVAMLFLLQRRGRCHALQWQAADGRYACGMVVAPGDYLRWLPIRMKPWASRWFARRIAAGLGCDSDIEIA